MRKLLLLCLMVAARANAADIVIQNGDPPDWGLNDKRPFKPVGGNNAHTLGEARMNGARHAAQLWGAVLKSDVPIVLKVSFNHEPCGAPGLANGGFQDSPADFPGAPKPGVHYPAALANALAGKDLNGDRPEGGVEVLAVYDDQPDCIGGAWYYGFDHPNNFAKYGLDYVSVLTHEIGHALGIASSLTVDGEGAIKPDVFDTLMYGETQHKFLVDMTAQERDAAVRDPHNLTWNGPNVNRAAKLYAAATTNGHLRLDAGSSCLAHWEAETTGESVGLTMTGSGNNEVRSDFLDVSTCEMQDMGWKLMPGARCPDVKR